MIFGLMPCSNKKKAKKKKKKGNQIFGKITESNMKVQIEFATVLI